jgi:hypothetical protein
VLPDTSLVAGAEAYELEGPRSDYRAVWLWADRYIPFERLSDQQRAAREELRLRLHALAAREGEILHASYAGSKPSNADVENLLLYNIDMGGASFLPNAVHGVRFELASGARRTSPSKRYYECSYQYRLISQDVEPSYWRRTRHVASFKDADLGTSATGRSLGRTWIGVRDAAATVDAAPLPPDHPFAVFLTLRSPSARPELRPELIKALVDGTVAAFEAQRDQSTLPEVARRVGSALSQRRQSESPTCSSTTTEPFSEPSSASFTPGRRVSNGAHATTCVSSGK